MIYVDNAFQYGDWKRGRMDWSGGGHMLSNDLEELHAFARRIGLRRAWFQDHTFPHYDLTRGRWQQALAEGATPIEAGDVPDDVLMRRTDGTYEKRCDRIARRKAEKENA